MASLALMLGFISSKIQDCHAYLRTGLFGPHNRLDMCVIL